MDVNNLVKASKCNGSLDKVILIKVEQFMGYLPEHYYHVYNRGARKQKIFFETNNYHHLINLFVKYHLKYQVTIASYCLMSNHYHLVLKQSDSGSIGAFLKTTFNAYTQSVNARFGLGGTLFQGQAKVKHIDTDSYCLEVIRYIHLNPVTAKLVSKPEEWEFSNYQEWIGLRDGILIDSALETAYFRSKRDYALFVSEYIEEKDKKIIANYNFNEDV